MNQTQFIWVKLDRVCFFFFRKKTKNSYLVGRPVKSAWSTGRISGGTSSIEYVDCVYINILYPVKTKNMCFH